MPSPRVRLPLPVPGWDALREELGVPGAFPADVLAEAEQARPSTTGDDLTDLPFLTIDPVGSTDLDQAMALSREGDGYRVRYAIADVAAWVVPGGAIDLEAHRRGETYYAPDRKAPLHPPVLSEDRASLLPDQDRPALLWTLDLDATGALVGTDVRRATVRSRRRLDYGAVQAMLDDSSATPDLQLLREIGLLRQERARDREAVDLPTPDQEVAADGTLTFRAQLPCEQWNAQLSLLTGMAAASLMLDGGIGVLRTLPVPDPGAVEDLRRSALALGVAWPDGLSYGDLLSGLDPSVPAAAALLSVATRLLRGAAYTAFDGERPAQVLHSAVGAPYAHTTAPLRRLVDRYVGETCVALCAGTPVPAWVRAALPGLPAEMERADKRAHALDRAVVDLAEAVVLQHRVGEVLDGVVTDKGTVQLGSPAVRGRLVAQDPPIGQRVRVRVEQVDVATRTVRFVLAG